MRTPNPEIRLVNPDGTLGEILPDWRTLEYLDDTQDVGSVTIEYPEKGGLRRALLDEEQEYALTLDGKEIDNSRFKLDADSGNKASDTPGYVTWAGKTLIARTEEAIVGPINDQAREDVFSPEERDAYNKARKEWVQQQIEKVRKKHLVQGITKNAEDDDSQKSSDTSSRWLPDEKDPDNQPPKIQAIVDNEGLWQLKLDPAYWRSRFEPPAGLQAKMDSAPPPKPPSFQKVTPGEFVRTLFEEAQSRGALQGLRIDFTAKKDSAGRPWATELSRKPEIGSTLLEHLQWLAEVKKAEPRMKRRTLQLYNADYGDPSSATVLLAKGKNIVDGPVENTTEELVTSVLCTSDTGVHGWVTDHDLVDRYGVIEGTYEVENVQTWRDLREHGREYLKAQGRRKSQQTYGITTLDQEGTRPYKDFRAGSWVLVAVDGGKPEPQRIRAITMSWDESRVMSCGVTLNDRIYEKDVTVARTVKALTGKGVTQPSKVTGQAHSSKQVSDGRPPRKPNTPTVATRNGTIEIGYDWTDVEGYTAVWDQAQVEVHVGETADYEISETTLADRIYTAGSTVLTQEPYSTPRYVRLVAVDTGGDRSEPSDPVEVAAAPINGGDLDPDGPNIPPPIVPGIIGEDDPDNEENPEGTLEWTGYVRAEKLLAGHFQTDLGVASRFYVTEYADPNDPQSGPAENAAIIEMTPDNGFVVWIPVLDEDTGEWVYDPSDPKDANSALVQRRTRSIQFPATAYEKDDPDDPDSDWHQVVARIAGGEMEVENLSANVLELHGPQRVNLGGSITLTSTVPNPTKTVSLSYGPTSRRWPATPDNARQIGMGLYQNGAFVTEARFDDVPGKNHGNLRVRYINPNTGYLDHDSDPFPFFAVAGFTMVGTRPYVLAKFTKQTDPWTIVRMQSDMSGFTNDYVNVDSAMGGGWNYGALGNCGRDDVIGFVFRTADNNIRFRYYNLDLTNHEGIPNKWTDTNTGRNPIGVPGVGICATASYTYVFDTVDPNQPMVENVPKSWWPYGSTMNGMQYLPGTGYIASNGNGQISVYNDAMPEPVNADHVFTYVNDDTGEETAHSEVVKSKWPTRTFATLQTPDPVPGSTDTRMYSGLRDGTLYRLPKDQGNQVVIAEVPTSGTVAPTETSFVAGTPTQLQSDTMIPGTNRPTAYIDAQGKTELYGLTSPGVSYRYTRGETVETGGAGTIAIRWDVVREAHPDIPYNATTGEFTMLLGGAYVVHSQMVFTAASGATAGYRNLNLLVNGVQIYRGVGAAGNVESAQLSTLFRVNAGDKVLFQIGQNSGVPIPLRTVDTENYLTMLRLGL